MSYDDKVTIIMPCDGFDSSLIIQTLSDLAVQTHRNIRVVCIAEKGSASNDLVEFINKNSKRFSLNEYVGPYYSKLVELLKNATGNYLTISSPGIRYSCDYFRLVLKQVGGQDLSLASSGLVKNGTLYCYPLHPLHNQIYVNAEWLLNRSVLFTPLIRLYNMVVNIRLLNRTNHFLKKVGNSTDYVNFEEELIALIWLQNAEKITIVNRELVYSPLDERDVKNSIHGIRNILMHAKKTNFGEESVKSLAYYCLKKQYGSNNLDQKVCNWLNIETGICVDVNKYNGYCTNKYYYQSPYPVTTVFNEEERFKKYISGIRCKCVSFDLFDTLVTRTYGKPEDLFGDLNDKYRSYLQQPSKYTNFSKIREIGQKKAYRSMRKRINGKEDLSLDEIYQSIEDLYGLPHDLIDYLKGEEKLLEINDCKRRSSVCDYLELAKYVKKRVVIISDTYLDKCTIDRILELNDISVDHVYLSSTIGLKKDTGSLFSHVLDCEKLTDPRELCHIGDNINSDYSIPKKLGIEAHHIDKTMDMLMGTGKRYSGSAFKNIFSKTNPYFIEYTAFESFVDLRRILQIIANKLYDNPFISFNSNSDFNTNPKHVGYGVVGPQLLSYLIWISKNISDDKNVIHFVSRDGWLLKEAYDLLPKECKKHDSNYLKISRKSLMCADIEDFNDLYSLVDKVNIHGMTIRDFINEISPIINNDEKEDIISYYNLRNEIDRKFQSELNYAEFVNTFISKFGDCIKFDNSLYKQYFSEIIRPGDVIFDIGYSGRPEASLSKLLGFPIDSFYVHSKTDVLYNRADQLKFNNLTFLDYRPSITGVIRENVMMETAPSVIGYKKSVEGITLVYDTYDVNDESILATKEIQFAALDFIKDCIHVFGSNILNLKCRTYDLALPSEYYYNLSKDADKIIFNNLIFDDPYGMGYNVSAIDFWKDRQGKLYRDLYVPQIETNCECGAVPFKPRGNRKKVLLYSNEISWSGAPRSLLRIGNCLRRNNYEVEYWGDIDKKDGFKKEIESYGISVFIVPQNDIRVCKNQFDLCIVNTILSYKAYDLISNIIPTVWYIREAKNIEDTFIKNQFIKKTLQSASNIYCVSEYASSFITPYNSDVRILHNCVEDRVINFNFEKKDGKIKLLSLGTVEPRKAFDVIVDAISLLKPEDYNNIEYYFAGREIKLKSAPTYFNDLMLKIQKYDNIHYLGALTSEAELDSAYRMCDAVLIPSRDESYSLVALEALMYGKPIVVSKNVGAKYLVSSNNGVIVDTGDSVAWAKAILKLSNRSVLEKMSVEARRTYELKASMKEYERNILKMVETHIVSSTINNLHKISNFKLPSNSADKVIVPIVLSSSSYYLKYAAVTIDSIIKNCSDNCYCDIFILSTDLSEKEIKQMEIIETNYRITCINISNLLEEDGGLFVGQNHVSRETYNRLYAPQILHQLYDRIIFIDSDMIVCKDISELYSISMSKTLAAAPNFMNRGMYDYVSKDMGLNPRTYVNCGLLVIDVKKYVANDVKTRCLDYISNGCNIRTMDQDAINNVCNGDIDILDPRWNVQWHNHCRGEPLVFNQDVYETALSDPFIIHYTDKIKAWNSPQFELAEVFWKYAYESKHFEEILLDNLGKSNADSIGKSNAGTRSNCVLKLFKKIKNKFHNLGVGGGK